MNRNFRIAAGALSAFLTLVVCCRCSNAASVSSLIPGNLLVLDSDDDLGNPSIFQVDPSTGTQTLFTSGGYMKQPLGMTFDAQGNIVVSDYSGNDIYRINIATGQQTLVAKGSNIISPTSIVVEPNGKYAVLDAYSANITLVDPVTGSQTVLATATTPNDSMLKYADKMTMDPNGNLLVDFALTSNSSANVGILRIDKNTGVGTPLTTGGNFTQQNYGGPLSLRTGTNDVVLVDRTSNYPYISSLLDVNLSTGAQSVLWKGATQEDPFSVDVSPKGAIYMANYAYPVTQPQGSVAYVTPTLYSVDPSNGAETLISSAGYLYSPQVILTVPEPGTLGVGAFAIFLAVAMPRQLKRRC